MTEHHRIPIPIPAAMVMDKNDCPWIACHNGAVYRWMERNDAGAALGMWIEVPPLPGSLRSEEMMRQEHIEERLKAAPLEETDIASETREMAAKILEARAEDLSTYRLARNTYVPAIKAELTRLAAAIRQSQR